MENALLLKRGAVNLSTRGMKGIFKNVGLFFLGVSYEALLRSTKRGYSTVSFNNFLKHSSKG
jgi:hypothetical protein